MAPKKSVKDDNVVFFSTSLKSPLSSLERRGNTELVAIATDTEITCLGLEDGKLG